MTPPESAAVIGLLAVCAGALITGIFSLSRQKTNGTWQKATVDRMLLTLEKQAETLAALGSHLSTVDSGIDSTTRVLERLVERIDRLFSEFRWGEK